MTIAQIKEFNDPEQIASILEDKAGIINHLKKSQIEVEEVNR